MSDSQRGKGQDRRLNRGRRSSASKKSNDQKNKRQGGVPILVDHRNSEGVVMMDAVFLMTALPESHSVSDLPSEHCKWVCPLYVDSMAEATGFMEQTQVEEVLLFAQTLVSFQILFRVLDSNLDRSIRLTVHNTLLSSDGVAVLQYVEAMGGDLVPMNDQAYLYGTIPLPVQQLHQSAAQRVRMQIFDHHRRLVFFREWWLEIGQLNQDAISWLSHVNFNLEELVQPDSPIISDALDDSEKPPPLSDVDPLESDLITDGLEDVSLSDDDDDDEFCPELRDARRRSSSLSYIEVLHPQTSSTEPLRRQSSFQILQPCSCRNCPECLLRRENREPDHSLMTDGCDVSSNQLEQSVGHSSPSLLRNSNTEDFSSATVAADDFSISRRNRVGSDTASVISIQSSDSISLPIRRTHRPLTLSHASSMDLLDDTQDSNPTSPQHPHSAVDLFQQLGFWLYGTKVGQMVRKQNLERNAIKTFYSQEHCIWILGMRFRNDQKPGPRILTLGPIHSIKAVRNLFLKLMPSISMDQSICDSYEICESFLTVPFDLVEMALHLQNGLISQLNWTDVTNETDASRLRLSASGLLLDQSDDIVSLSLDCQSVRLADVSLSTHQRNRVYGTLTMRCRANVSLLAALLRSLFLSTLTAFMAHLETKSASSIGIFSAPFHSSMQDKIRSTPPQRLVEFLRRSVSNCHVDMGPQSSGHIITISPAACGSRNASSSPDTNTTDDASGTNRLEYLVLVWFDHIGDWVLRRLRLGEHGHLAVIYPRLGLSPFKNGDPHDVSSAGAMVIDVGDIPLTSSVLFFSTDGSLRFALASSNAPMVAGSGANAMQLFYLRALSVEDFSQLLTAIPDTLRSLRTSQQHRSIATIPVSHSSSRSSPSSSSSSTAIALASSSASSPQAQSTPVTMASDQFVSLGMDAFHSVFFSRFWFTYRNNFAGLTPSILTSDVGFGCLIRAGQSMLAEALAMLTFGRRDWNYAEMAKSNSMRRQYREILNVFLDRPSMHSPLSIHHLVREGASLGTPIGQCFDPTTLCRAIRRLLVRLRSRQSSSLLDQSSSSISLLTEGGIDADMQSFRSLQSFQMSASMDSSRLVLEATALSSSKHQVERDDWIVADHQIATDRNNRSNQQQNHHRLYSEENGDDELIDNLPKALCTLGVTLWRQGVIDQNKLKTALVKSGPQIVLMPLRLGVDCINEDAYGVLIHACLANHLTLGIIGGRQSRAFYIVGYQDRALLYLDPHVLRPYNPDLDEAIRLCEYHCQYVSELSLEKLDPTVLFCFLCKDVQDADNLVASLLAVPVSVFSCAS